MSDLLSFNPSRALTANIRAAAAAKAYFYDAGTSTPKTVYSDAALTTPHPSPLEADAGGIFAQVFTDGAACKVVVQTSGGATLYTLDPAPTDRVTGFSLIGTFFDDVTELLADAVMTYSAGSAQVVAGDVIGTRKEGFSYVVAASGASDQHVTTAGGVKLYVQAQGNGVSVKAFGALGDGAANDTAKIQAAIDYCSANGLTLLTPAGVYNHTGLTISKPLKWVGSAVRGPVYGVQTGFEGAVFQHTATTGDALTIGSSALLSNQGLCVEMESLHFEGNKNVVGAVSGGGINLVGDTAGEDFFVQGSVFRNVHVWNAKGDAWTITGTCFLNTWYDCAGMYSGGKGFTHNAGAGGNPTNNNWVGGYLNDNTGCGLDCTLGKMTLTATNISQNAGGGVIQSGGYLILNNCDFEKNTGTTIAVTSSSAATYILGGMIHKTPAGAAITGISFGAGCAKNQVVGVLFANFDNAADRLLAFSGGGTLGLFEYRTQNVLSSAFPTSLWASIERIPPKEKILTGGVTFAGSGIGLRTATATFSTPFELDYVISVTPNAAFASPQYIQVSFDQSTKGLSSIGLQCYVSNAGYADVGASYIAVGR